MTRKSLWMIVALALLAMSACTTPAPTQRPTPEPTAGPPPITLEDGKLYLAIIWHQHQPVYYKDPATGVYQKPWVRVHAAKDYVDMAAMLQNYPDIHVTFNLTPSLISQLDDFANGAKDLYWVKTVIPADQLSEDDKRFLLERFFDINPTIIARFPRYQELADLRGGASPEQIDAALQSWQEQDYRDLQVLFNLAWTDPDWLAQEPLASLVAKGRDFAEADKQTVLDEHLKLIKEVIPLHAEMQRSGQIEVTMTPYAHPILPLLVNTDLAKVAMPDAPMPTPFQWGQDAIAQVDLGTQFYEDHFGAAPRGMWPAEGSVAQVVVDMIAKAGIQWIATDEDVLAKSLPGFSGFTRNSADTVQQADQLYQPYLVQGTRNGPVAILFRDHLISDKVGFTYSQTPGDQAAADLIQRLHNIKDELNSEGATGPHLVTILLDGENAWEYYPNDGKDFLNALYGDLSSSDDIVTVTPSEYLAGLAAQDQTPPKIANLWPGSWIDGTFSTWIGEDEENQAWDALGRTRKDLQAAIDAGTLDDATQQQAMTLMYIAEGSDWFWWYGADQNSGSDADFDNQFRSYLAQIYQTIGQPVPDFVHVPIVAQAAQAPAQEPLALLNVTVDGQAGDGEWQDAGLYGLADATPPTNFYYGFDINNLYLRLDGPFDLSALDGTTYGFYLKRPRGGPTNAYTRYGQGTTLPGFGINELIEVTFSSGAPQVAVYSADGQGGWTPFAGEGDIQAAISADTLEIGLPFTAFAPDLRSGDRFSLRLVVSQDGTDGGMFPADGPALLTVPDLPLPNVVLDVTDPQNDDHGPGSYTYPTDGVFKSGVFDVTHFQFGYDDNDYVFRIDVRGPVENVWGSPNGLSVQTVDVYIDTDGPSTGDRLLLPGRNAALTSEYGWDYALWAEGWTPGVYTPSSAWPGAVVGPADDHHRPRHRAHHAACAALGAARRPDDVAGGRDGAEPGRLPLGGGVARA